MVQQAPVFILFVFAVVMSFQFIVADSGIGTEQDFNVSDPNNSSTFEFESDPGIFGVLSTIWDVITTFISLLTFGLIGAPRWLRVILTITMNGSMAWAVAALIRGGQ